MLGTVAAALAFSAPSGSALRPPAAVPALPRLRAGAPAARADAPMPPPRISIRKPVLPTMVAPAAAALGGVALLAPSAAHAASVAAASSDLGSSFASALSLIFVSELGDKTFFIAAILAASASRLLTFAGCAGALALMTVLSVAIGQIFHAVPDSLTAGLPIDDYVAIASFLFFGVKSIVDALGIEEDGEGIAEEREDAQEALGASGLLDGQKGGWPLVAQACTLTLAAEIGDRSQLATIALGAAANPYGVALGGTLGHCFATGLAVLGGSFISKYLSERAIGLVGGALFLVFAATTALGVF